MPSRNERPQTALDQRRGLRRSTLVEQSPLALKRRIARPLQRRALRRDLWGGRDEKGVNASRVYSSRFLRSISSACTIHLQGPRNMRLILFLAILPCTQAYISGLRALFLPCKTLDRSEAEALHLPLGDLPLGDGPFHSRGRRTPIWLPSGAAPPADEPKSALAMLGTQVGTEAMITSRSGHVASIKTRKVVRQKKYWNNGFAALEDGLF